MIDTDKYEGHTEGEWEYDSATIHATAKGGNEIIAEYPCWNYNKDQLITKEEEANLRLMTDAPLLLAEVKRLREIINKAMQQHTVLEMRGQLFESQCIDAEGQYESGQWERDEE